MNTIEQPGTMFLTIAETARELRVPPRHIYNLLEAGRLRSVTLGRSRRVVRDSVLALVNEAA